MNDINVNKKIAMYFGIKEQDWSSNLKAAWELAGKCNEVNSGVDFIQFREVLRERATLISIGYPPEDAALLICECLLSIIEPTPTTQGDDERKLVKIQSNIKRLIARIDQMDYLSAQKKFELNMFTACAGLVEETMVKNSVIFDLEYVDDIVSALTQPDLFDTQGGDK